MALLADSQAKSHYIKENKAQREGITEEPILVFFLILPNISPPHVHYSSINGSMWPPAETGTTSLKRRLTLHLTYCRPARAP